MYDNASKKICTLLNENILNGYNGIKYGININIDDTDLIYTFKTNDLHIISKDKVAWTLDGEFGGEHDDLTIKNLNKQITIMC